jgi:hypothetical protein
MASRSYREFYGRAGWPDPFAGDYSTFFGRYAPTGTPNAAALLGTFSTVDDRSVFAYLGRDHMVYLAHRMALFTVPFGHSVSQHDSKVIAIRNEITEGGANYLHLTGAFFEAVNVPNVLMAADITAAFAADADVEQLPPADPNTTGTDITTRRSMWVPPPYVGELFAHLEDGHGNGYISPRALWSIAEAALADPTHSVGCSMFIDWCRCIAGGGVKVANPLLPTTARCSTLLSCFGCLVQMWTESSVCQARAWVAC